MPRGRKKETENAEKNDSESVIYRCAICPYTSERLSNLKRHEIKIHGELENKPECCEIIFNTKSDLHEHMRREHKNGYKCKFDDCEQTFKNKPQLERHYKSNTHCLTKDYECSGCTYGSNHKSNILRHCRNSEHKCPQLDDHKEVNRKRKMSTSTVTTLSKDTSISSESPVDNPMIRRKRRKPNATVTSSEEISSQDTAESTSTLPKDYSTPNESPIEYPRKLKRDWYRQHMEEASRTAKEELLQVAKKEEIQAVNEEASQSLPTPQSTVDEPMKELQHYCCKQHVEDTLQTEKEEVVQNANEEEMQVRNQEYSSSPPTVQLKYSPVYTHYDFDPPSTSSWSVAPLI